MPEPDWPTSAISSPCFDVEADAAQHLGPRRADAVALGDVAQAERPGPSATASERYHSDLGRPAITAARPCTSSTRRSPSSDDVDVTVAPAAPSASRDGRRRADFFEQPAPRGRRHRRRARRRARASGPPRAPGRCRRHARARHRRTAPIASCRLKHVVDRRTERDRQIAGRAHDPNVRSRLEVRAQRDAVELVGDEVGVREVERDGAGAASRHRDRSTAAPRRARRARRSLVSPSTGPRDRRAQARREPRRDRAEIEVPLRGERRRRDQGAAQPWRRRQRSLAAIFAARAAARARSRAAPMHGRGRRLRPRARCDGPARAPACTRPLGAVAMRARREQLVADRRSRSGRPRRSAAASLARPRPVARPAGRRPVRLAREPRVPSSCTPGSAKWTHSQSPSIAQLIGRPRPTVAENTSTPSTIDRLRVTSPARAGRRGTPRSASGRGEVDHERRVERPRRTSRTPPSRSMPIAATASGLSGSTASSVRQRGATRSPRSTPMSTPSESSDVAHACCASRDRAARTTVGRLGRAPSARRRTPAPARRVRGLRPSAPGAMPHAGTGNGEDHERGQPHRRDSGTQLARDAAVDTGSKRQAYPLAESDSGMSRSADPAASADPKGPAESTQRTQRTRSRSATRPAGPDATAAAAGTSDIDALAADVAAGRLTPREAIDRLVDATGAGLAAARARRAARDAQRSRRERSVPRGLRPGPDSSVDPRSPTTDRDSRVVWSPSGRRDWTHLTCACAVDADDRERARHRRRRSASRNDAITMRRPGRSASLTSVAWTTALP